MAAAPVVVRATPSCFVPFIVEVVLEFQMSVRPEKMLQLCRPTQSNALDVNQRLATDSSSSVAKLETAT